MKKYFIIILAISLAISLFITNRQVESSANDNVFGWAWSENIGWISFNNITDGSSIDYGVNIDSQAGKFSGYAWSENIGWISFNEADTGTPPSDDPCNNPSCIAKVSNSGQLGKGNVDVEGWARALSNNDDWDGWIRFDHGQTGETYIDSNGDFHGWAWGSDVIGWISFSGTNYKTTLDLSKFNQAPSAINLSVDQGDYCLAPYPPIILSWEFFDVDLGDTQSAYQVQADNNSNFSSPEKDSGKVASSSASYAPMSLPYNATYYWRVMVWDEKDEPSDNWAECVSGDCVLNTPHHDYPMVDFDWDPINPAAEELITFTDRTTYYGGSTGQSWDWDFGDEIGTSTLPKPDYSYSDTGSYDVSLTACDSDGYCCLVEKSLGTSYPMPEWEETHP